MKSRTSSAPRQIRINWLDGSTTTHEGLFPRSHAHDLYSEAEVFIWDSCGPIWLDARYADDGCRDQKSSSDRTTLQGKSRVRKTTRKETK